MSQAAPSRRLEQSVALAPTAPTARHETRRTLNAPSRSAAHPARVDGRRDAPPAPEWIATHRVSLMSHEQQPLHQADVMLTSTGDAYTRREWREGIRPAYRRLPNGLWVVRHNERNRPPASHLVAEIVDRRAAARMAMPEAG